MTAVATDLGTLEFDLLTAQQWRERQEQLTNDLSMMTLEHWGAKEELLEAKTDLQVNYAKLLASGDIFGKNEGQRQAMGRELLEPLYARVENAEQDERTTALMLSLIKIEEVEFKAMFRLLELYPDIHNPPIPARNLTQVTEVPDLEEEE